MILRDAVDQTSVRRVGSDMMTNDDISARSGQVAPFQGRLAELIKRVGGLRGAARAVNVHFDTVGRWRDGQQKMPLQAAVMLCKAADVSLDWLANGHEAEIPEPREPSRQGANLVDAEDVRVAAEFVVRATIAIEGLKTETNSDAIADAIVRRALDLEAQRALRIVRDADEVSRAAADGSVGSRERYDVRSAPAAHKRPGIDRR